MAYQNFLLGSSNTGSKTIISQGETLVLLEPTSKEKKKNKIFKIKTIWD